MLVWITLLKFIIWWKKQGKSPVLNFWRVIENTKFYNIIIRLVQFSLSIDEMKLALPNLSIFSLLKYSNFNIIDKLTINIVTAFDIQ